MDDTEARETTVDSHKCVWCKHKPQTPIHLSTGETLCQTCLGDLREWKRTRYVDLLVSSSLESSTQTTLLTEWRRVRDVLSTLHNNDPKLKALPTRTSNAHAHLTTNDP